MYLGSYLATYIPTNTVCTYVLLRWFCKSFSLLYTLCLEKKKREENNSGRVTFRTFYNNVEDNGAEQQTKLKYNLPRNL